MFPEAAFVGLPREDVGHEVSVGKHAENVFTSLLDTFAHYLTPLNVSLESKFKL